MGDELAAAFELHTSTTDNLTVFRGGSMICKKGGEIQKGGWVADITPK